MTSVFPFVSVVSLAIRHLGLLLTLSSVPQLFLSDAPQATLQFISLPAPLELADKSLLRVDALGAPS